MKALTDGAVFDASFENDIVHDYIFCRGRGRAIIGKRGAYNIHEWGKCGITGTPDMKGQYSANIKRAILKE